mmetsp:Transcript_5777/g.8394  ORF Transcript_5777/g.8394 Transcript_5777/m.8394 type:complete len:97 (+) Transcript_5777:211-501(+)
MNTTGVENDTLLGGSDFVVPFHAGAFIFDDTKSNYIIGKGPSDESLVETLSFLTEPTLALEFDFTSREALPPSSGRSFTIDARAIKNGAAHGVYFW